MPKICLFTFIISMLSNLAVALTDAEENLRETCRLRVAGRFLELYDMASRGEKAVMTLQKKRALLASKHKEKEVEREKMIESSFAKRGANFFLEEFEGVGQDVKSLQNAITQIDDVLAKETVIWQTAKLKLQALEQRIGTVFLVTKTQTKNLPYQFHIDFRRPCARYRLSCPLTDEEARKLTALFQDPKELPLACQRYADFLRTPSNQ